MSEEPKDRVAIVALATAFYFSNETEGMTNGERATCAQMAIAELEKIRADELKEVAKQN